MVSPSVSKQGMTNNLHFDVHLENGLVLKPRRHMRLLSPDKSKVLMCYGGLRVDETTLVIQSRVSCWESIAKYRTKEEAIVALQKVNKAIKENLEYFEL